MTSREQRVAAAAIVAVGFLKESRKSKKNKRSCWVKPWISRRQQLGVTNNLVSELQLEDALQFRNFIRMTAVQLEQLITSVGPAIAKKDTPMRQAISVRERILVTLRFVASGDSYNSLQYLFRIPVCTIGRIVNETTRAIYDVLKEENLKFPKTTEEWLRLSQDFDERWNFPHCVGALDGKHIVIQAPNNSGSIYYNYKGTHSIILMAAVDANYKFTYIDVGCNGRASDGGVFDNSSLRKGLEENTIRLPTSQPLPGREIPVPYVFIADDAFAMKSYILKPYPFRNQPAPNRIFNYRLSRARRIVENAFGIIANRFRVLRRPINLCPKTTENIVLAICTIHNLLLSTKESRSAYFYPGSIDTEDAEAHNIQRGDWHIDNSTESSFFPLQQGRTHNYTLSQKNVRDEFKDYFLTELGEVSWQYRHI